MAYPPHRRMTVSFGDGGQWQHDVEHALLIFSGDVTISISPNIPEPVVPPVTATIPLVYIIPVPPGFIPEVPPGFPPHPPPAPAPAPAPAPIPVPPLAFAAAPSSSEESESSEESDTSEDSDSSEETDPISLSSSIVFSSESSSASNSMMSTATSRQKRMTAPEYRASFQLRAPSDSSPTECDGSNRRNQDPGPSRGPFILSRREA